MTRSIAIFGGSFNPPGLHHQAVASLLTSHFDEVIVVACGPRPDKPVTDDVPPVFRAAMVQMAFQGIPGVRVDLTDLEERTFHRTFELDDRYRAEGETWHVVGTDLVQGGGAGMAPIQREWARGPEIWSSLHFAVVERPGFKVAPEDLPPQSRRIPLGVPGSSSAIRDLVFHNRPYGDLLPPRVAAYIERHRLYSGGRPGRTTSLHLEAVRPRLVFDEHNPRARALAEEFGPEASDPNLIVVIGGDGTMLRAIRSEWHRRLPFYGVNAGHLGFLLNARPPTGELVVEHLPLLFVESTASNGTQSSGLAFNDTWVERAAGQTAWIRVSVDGGVRLDPLVADGALVATAAGSTSYARAMGAHSLPVNTPALLLVGSNVLRPTFFQPAVLPEESRVELLALDPEKRPLRGYLDGVPLGEVTRLAARVSRTASVELAFHPDEQPALKLAQIQFPP